MQPRRRRIRYIFFIYLDNFSYHMKSLLDLMSAVYYNFLQKYVGFPTKEKNYGSISGLICENAAVSRNKQKGLREYPSLSGWQKRHFQKQEVIWSEGEPARRVGIVLSGCVQVVSEDVFGNRNILEKLTPGNCSGRPMHVRAWEEVRSV